MGGTLIGLLAVSAGYILFAIIIGIAARGRGRSGIAWFLIALVISPLLALLLLVLLPVIVHLPPTKICPRCAETVMQEAKICHFCSFDFTDPESFGAIQAAQTRRASYKRRRSPVAKIAGIIVRVLLAIFVLYLLFSNFGYLR